MPLADLVRRCLAKDPRSRPVAADIVHMLSAHGVSPSPDPAALDLLARRIPQFVVGSAVLGLGVMQLVSELIQNGMLGGVFDADGACGDVAGREYLGHRLLSEPTTNEQRPF